MLMLETGADWLARSRLPELGRAVSAARQNRLPVWTKGHRTHPTLMQQGISQLLSTVCLPKPGRSVITSCQDDLPVGAEGHAHDRTGMGEGWVKELPRVDVP